MFDTKGTWAMNWDRIEGQWKQQRGKATHHWGKVMNDDLAVTAGKYEDLVGRLQERFGIARDAAKAEVDELKKTIKQLRRSNGKLVRLQKSLHKKGEGGRKARQKSKSIKNTYAA
jgi:uncharacterized protein YjbJ (UPF0337 family)